MYWKTNRVKKRAAKRGQFWCPSCDCHLVADGQRCPNCGKVYNKRRHKKDYIFDEVEEE